MTKARDTKGARPARSDHVRALLIAQGKMTAEGISRSARARHCPKCGRVIMSGLDGDLCAFSVDVEPQPVDRYGEALALLSGRRSYSIRRVAGHYEIDERCAIRIAANSADDVEVLITHICGQPFTAPSRARARRLAPPERARPGEGAPPF